MRAVPRRSNGPRHPRLSVRELEIHLASRVVTLAGEVVQLSAKEFELLVALAEDPERVFKKEELLRNFWGFRSLSLHAFAGVFGEIAFTRETGSDPHLARFHGREFVSRADDDVLARLEGAPFWGHVREAIQACRKEREA